MFAASYTSADPICLHGMVVS